MSLSERYLQLICRDELKLFLVSGFYVILFCTWMAWILVCDAVVLIAAEELQAEKRRMN